MIKLLVAVMLMPVALALAAGDMDFAKSECVSIDGANLLTVEGLDQILLVGIQPPDKDSKYYGKAVSYLRDKLLGEIVRIDVDPDVPKNDDGQLRAVIYYRMDEKWVNVNIELIEQGLGKVAVVPGSYFDTKVYITYEKEARAAERGIWKDWEQDHEVLDLEKEYEKSGQ